MEEIDYSQMTEEEALNDKRYGPGVYAEWLRQNRKRQIEQERQAEQEKAETRIWDNAVEKYTKRR